MQISKTEFFHFLRCPKSFWLKQHRPEDYPSGEFTAYAKMLADDGQKVKEHARDLLSASGDAEAYSYQTVFETPQGLYANADVTKSNDDGSITLYEVKSSMSVKQDRKHNHIKDAAFQKVVAEDAGAKVAEIFIVHLNSEYVRNGEVDPEELLIFTNVTEQVLEIEAEVRTEIDGALELLVQKEIDESSCTCLGLSRSNHCDSFNHFNPNIPEYSIYDLPRITSARLRPFVAEGRFSLDLIKPDEVSATQAIIVQAAHAGEPLVDQNALNNFYERAVYPIYFLDYETYSSAIPLVDGAQPHAPIPFQYSLHIKRSADDEEPAHVEYLADEAAMPAALVDHLAQNIGEEGSIVSWHASFENTQNQNMAKLYPDRAKFLNDLISRTLDLEELFKDGYVDIAFRGSTSIKKVLPVICPDLSYDGLVVGNGTDAMNAWIRLLSLPQGAERAKLRDAMLGYCKLDTYAMFRIFEKMKKA